MPFRDFKKRCFSAKKRRTPKKVADLEKKFLDLQSQLDARDRTIAVLETQNDVMALELDALYRQDKNEHRP